MLEIVLFGSVFMIAFAYFGYPITLLVLGWFKGRDVIKASILPTVTFIVTVHNEEKRIREKLLNTLALDYPKDSLVILVASDGSNDRTNEIVREFAGQGVTLLELPEKRGKENAQKEAVKKVTGEIIVFSDVATTMETAGLRHLVSNFADQTVGCVSSEDRLVTKDGKPSGEGVYVRYEMWLRTLESRANSLVGLSGSLFAARREVCQDFSGDMQSDFRTVLNSVRMGLRGVSDRDTLGLYQDTADPKREWDRKIRTVVRGLTVFFRHVQLLNIFKYGLFSYQLFCHKFLRWAVPLLMLLALASNLALAIDSTPYGVLLGMQLAFYALGLLGLASSRMQSALLVKLPMYFLAVNASIAIAWWRYLTGQRIVTWTPTKR